MRSAIIDAPIERVWAVLRDFNSHAAWHPVVAESHIERGEPSDQVGCVRNFTLRDGNHIREQLLTLSDRDFVSTYCILDATLPMRRYVATVTLEARHGRRAHVLALGIDVRRAARARARVRRSRRPRRLRRRLRGPAILPAPRRRARQRRRAMRSRAARDASCRASAARRSCRQARRPRRRPAAGEVRVRHTAIGVNYIDVYVRRGDYRMIEPPAVPGMEAAGVVIDVGEGVAHLLPGDRVAYACTPPGAYAEVRTLRADQVVALPDDIADETAAALMLKGLSAVLPHASHASRRARATPSSCTRRRAVLGLLLCAWAKALGARVIGTASSDGQSAARARARRGRRHRRRRRALRCGRTRADRRSRRRRHLRRARRAVARREPGGARDVRPLDRLRAGGRRALVGRHGGAVRQVGDVVAPGAVPLHRHARAARGDGRRAVCRRPRQRPAHGDSSPVSARRRGGRAPRSRSAANGGPDRAAAIMRWPLDALRVLRPPVARAPGHLSQERRDRHARRCRPASTWRTPVRDDRGRPRARPPADRAEGLAGADRRAGRRASRCPPCDVRVLAVRPSDFEGELHGLYEPDEDQPPALISVWMKTAQRKQVVAFRSFVRTLVHELLHHLDYEHFKPRGDVPHRRLLQARVEPGQRDLRRRRHPAASSQNRAGCGRIASSPRSVATRRCRRRRARLGTSTSATALVEPRLARGMTRRAPSSASARSGSLDKE